MTSTNHLEFTGTLVRHPVAELLVEFSQKRLSGSLRLSTSDKKSVVYFEEGQVVFAVSNARCHRLYELLLNQNQLEKSKLGEIEEFTNDFHLARSLVEKGLFTKPGIDAVFVFQITEILNDALKWRDGEFVFSAAARIKSGIHFKIDLAEILASHLERIETSTITDRFASLAEGFALREGFDINTLSPTPEEAFLLSRLGKEPLSVEMLRAMCGLESEQLLPILYRLWFIGVVSRSGWAEAIAEADSSKLAGAKMELKVSARSYEEEREKAALAASEEADRIEEEERAAQESVKEETLEDYLAKVEAAATHYEIFDVSPDAKLSAIKSAYFSLAKKYHPDLFYRQVTDEIHTRIQDAFTEIAQAYETLKDSESREIYDFKLRKVIEQLREAQHEEKREAVQAAGGSEKAAEEFERGYDYLLKDKIQEALPFLARAVNMESGNGRYHAFYGRALTFDKDNQRKAEGELQQALKLEPQNAHFRVMLAELYIEIGLKVRAKGELSRLLESNPNHKEAAALLDTL